MLGEYLHPAPLIPSVAHNKLTAALHDCNFPAENSEGGVLVSSDCDLPRVPQLPLPLPSHAELISVGAVLLKDLDPVIVGVRHDDFLLKSQTKPVRRVELTLAWSELTELTAKITETLKQLKLLRAPFVPYLH